jgi:L-lactate utilization protein LutB
MAEQIKEMGFREFSDPQDVHDTVAGMHQIVQALQETLQHMGEALAETGTHPAYSQAASDAASQMSGIADELEAVTAGGVMRGPGS